ncbi:alpha/beta-hydrolase [Calocera cornea HHB12733]|uniref:Alpha/beta-hydrolase n=1 Tax=Calocera cornea HHB12733 TaxID=1353952 RepID=A0A165HQ95_9BASI|nr:alpha/beta-hydrolase [Calocera cornea HHB12733]
MTGTNSSSGTYTLSGTLCVPKAGDQHVGTIQLLVHGIAFDSTYWDFSYQPQKYSYVYAAAEAGYTTFAYDRLGTGKSDKPDGYHVVQSPTDLQILISFISLLHEGKIGGKTYKKIIGVGHSYGSIQLAAASAVVPAQLSALVLTGFSANASYIPQFETSNAFTRADMTFPSRFAGLAGEYVVSGLPQSSQINFLLYPYYDPDAAEVQWETSQPVSMGVLFTLGAIGGAASGFTGPVHVVTGDSDWVFCGSQCGIRPDGVHTILELVGPTVFPKSDDFSVYSPANTGHGLNLHYTAPESYADIMGWLKAIKY